jgi:hypothetical protein
LAVAISLRIALKIISPMSTGYLILCRAKVTG